MAISYIHEQSGAKVDKEPWRWVAIYNDGTELKQFELGGGRAVFHKFDEIDQSRLAAFIMMHDTHPAHTLQFDPGTMKLVHFYRNQILNVPLDDKVHNQEIRHRLYYFGYELPDGTKHLTGILPDGSSIITSDPDHIVKV